MNVITERYSLYEGDCISTMRGFAHSPKYAVITDPPYGNEKSIRFGNRGNLAAATSHRTMMGNDRPFDPFHLLNFPHIVLWGANWYADKLPISGGWLVWDKKDDGPSNDFSDCEMAWTNCLNTTRIFRHKWRGMIRDSERGEPRIHNTQKAIALMEWVLEICRIPFDVIIFDPYMGSGTTGVAAINKGYQFIGCEIDPYYFCAAQKRIADADRAVQGLPKQLRGKAADIADMPLFAAIGETP